MATHHAAASATSSVPVLTPPGAARESNGTDAASRCFTTLTLSGRLVSIAAVISTTGEGLACHFRGSGEADACRQLQNPRTGSYEFNSYSKGSSAFLINEHPHTLAQSSSFLSEGDGQAAFFLFRKKHGHSS